MGARPIPRADFCERAAVLVERSAVDWPDRLTWSREPVADR